MESALTSCEWNTASFLIFSPNVEHFVYYSHLLPLVTSLLLGGYVLYNNWRSLANRVLFFITLMFSLWVYFDLILWASPTPEDVIFFWSIIVPVEMLIYAGCLYLVYIFANGQKDISMARKYGIAVFFIPIVIFLHTSYTVLGLSPDCDTGVIEGPLIQYMYVVEVIYIIWAALTITRGIYRLKSTNEKIQLLLIGLGTIMFLISFTAGNITLIFSVNPDWEQYKLFGMPIFAAFVSYCLVRFKAFNSKALTSEILVVALAVATISLQFLRTLENVRIVAALTFILVCGLGYILVRNVRREIELRKHTEVLAKELAETNQRQESLIHFVGHEVKGFLTKDMAAFAALSEGDFGPIPETMKPFVEGALAQSRDGANSVIDILQASNQKKGTIEYAKKPFNFAELVGKWYTKLKPLAEKKGLTMTLTIDETGAPYTITGDEGQTGDHVLRNLIENSINYTLRGSIALSLVKKGPFAVFTVADTGVGISDEDKQHLFTEGGHGKESIKINAHSTGYGLFIAKNIIDAEGGTIRAESEGTGKGSQFIVALPIHT